MINLSEFCQIVDYNFFYVRRRILESVTDKLQEFYESDKKVCNISLPPRMGKSYIGTLFSVWLYFTQNQNIKIFRVCNESSLFETFSRQTKYFLELYGNIFYDKPPVIRGTLDRWYINDNTIPNFFGGGVGGNITGFGANIAIFDDMYKNYQDATSAAYDNFLNSFLSAVVYGRMEKDNYKIINIGTRWTTNDWFTKFNPDYEIILPALTKNNITICEDYKSTDELLSIRSKIEPYLWNAQYMQQPTLVGRQKIFNVDKIAIVETLPEEAGTTFCICDPATNLGSDFFTVGYYKKIRGSIYLLDMFAKQGCKNSEVIEYLRTKNPKYIIIEMNGIGKNVSQKLREAGFKNLFGFTTKTDKYNRAANAIDFLENYFYILNTCTNINLLLEQIENFPLAEHDDLVDNIIMAVENIKKIY